MTDIKMTPQRKLAEMEFRQKEALRLEEVALDATRQKTARLRALRLEKERIESEEKERILLQKRAMKAASPARRRHQG